MDNNSAFGQLLEKGQSTATNTFSDVTNSLKSQVFGDQNTQTQQPALNTIPNNQPEVSNQQLQDSQDQTRDMVRDFYAPGDDAAIGQSIPLPNDEERLAKTRQELQVQKQKYNDLHREVYYDPLFAYEQKKPEPTKAEEQEEEKQDKMQELAQSQAKKDQDIALQRQQTKTETSPGTIG